jgi:geranylgeranyl reductase family protein
MTRSVAVVGAGPAGCAAALTLGLFGLDVLLLERGARGKDKPCGDALVPASVRQLEAFFVRADSLAALGGVTYERATIVDSDGRQWTSRADGWVVPRRALDQRLRDIASSVAKIEYGATVRDVAPASSAGFRVHVSAGQSRERVVEVDGVVIATGSAARLAARLGVDGQPVMAAAVTQYVHGATVEGLEFFLSESLRPGYAWVFPSSERHANVGVCTLRPDAARTLRARQAELLTELGVASAGPLRGGGALVWSGAGTTWHHPAGLVSCGDAAGIVDPMSGEGISGALTTGRKAGVALGRFLAKGHTAALEEYSSWIRSHFEARYGGPVTDPVYRLFGAG